MMVKFRNGAILEQLNLMGSGTGRMRDATGLTPSDIQKAIKEDGASDDIAEIIVGYLGEGILLNGEVIADLNIEEPEVVEDTEEYPVEEPAAEVVDEDVLPEIDITLTVDEIVEKVKSGEWPIEAVLELEGAKEKPRSTLISELEELEA